MPPDNQVLHEHAGHTLHFMADLIEFGLKDMDLYKRQLAFFVKQHRKYGINYQEICV